MLFFSSCLWDHSGRRLQRLRGGRLRSSARLQRCEHAGHPLRDALRPRIPTAGEELHPLPGQQALVWHRLLPQYVKLRL
ncbi:hypothetical protein EYF80_059425 [Liparis tanakae]|uniref:Uncharacterized protein n=1 Tax=Liparis tanakae TaxID=230148 RepID=A0A4Z2ENQ4_9TELE|nr:hypothetical protein EYF80_059425 [Liparis tanakae]